MTKYITDNYKDIQELISKHKCDNKLNIIHRLYNMDYIFYKDTIKENYEKFCNKINLILLNN